MVGFITPWTKNQRRQNMVCIFAPGRSLERLFSERWAEVRWGGYSRCWKRFFASFSFFSARFFHFYILRFSIMNNLTPLFIYLFFLFHFPSLARSLVLSFVRSLACLHSLAFEREWERRNGSARLKKNYFSKRKERKRERKKRIY